MRRRKANPDELLSFIPCDEEVEMVARDPCIVKEFRNIDGEKLRLEYNSTTRRGVVFSANSPLGAPIVSDCVRRTLFTKAEAEWLEKEWREITGRLLKVTSLERTFGELANSLRQQNEHGQLAGVSDPAASEGVTRAEADFAQMIEDDNDDEEWFGEN